MEDHRGFADAVVFRRLDDASELRWAARLLLSCGIGSDPACIWYGLSDLTATQPDGLAGAAVVRPVDGVRVQLCGLAVAPAYRGRGLGRRLIGEVADRLRASGIEQVLAPPVHDARLAALLARAGFVALAPGWTLLPL